MKIIFAGTPALAATILKRLLNTEHEVIAVYTQPDRPAGRGRQLMASPVKQLALKHHIPVEQPESLQLAIAQQQLADYQPDLIIVVAYGLVLPVAALNIPKHGCWNVHVSLLPRWRGAAPIQRAIEAGDVETGVTVMQMDQGLDTGDILWQQTCSIGLETTSGELHDQLAELGAEALLATLQALQAGELKPVTQASLMAEGQKACYAKKLSKQEALIDWTRSAVAIERQIRAFDPWPVCYFECDGKRIKIWQATVLNEVQNITAQPGDIVAVNSGGVDMATGQGTLRLLKLQLPGAKPQLVKDILNGHAGLFQPWCR